MEKRRIEYMKKGSASDNLSPLARKLLTECVKAIEQLKTDKTTAESLCRKRGRGSPEDERDARGCYHLVDGACKFAYDQDPEPPNPPECYNMDEGEFKAIII